MKAIVFDIGGTLMEYKGMPLSWPDYYKTAFEFVCEGLDLDIIDDDIDKSLVANKRWLIDLKIKPFFEKKAINKIKPTDVRK